MMQPSIEMVRQTEHFEVTWDESLEVLPLSEDRQADIAHLYHRASAPLYHHPQGGNFEQCLYDVERYITYHRRSPLYALFLKASTLVYDRCTGDLIGVCLCAGSPTEGHIFNIFVDPMYRRRGLATKMLKRALTVFADTHEKVDLEADPDGFGVFVYRKLGFVEVDKSDVNW